MKLHVLTHDPTGAELPRRPLVAGGGVAMSGNDTNRPALWRVIEQAVIVAPEPKWSVAGNLYAAQIRALRDWLVPEEEPPHREMRPGGIGLTYQETLFVERQHLRALLTDQANRAEVGHE